MEKERVKRVARLICGNKERCSRYWTTSKERVYRICREEEEIDEKEEEIGPCQINCKKEEFFDELQNVSLHK